MKTIFKIIVLVSLSATLIECTKDETIEDFLAIETLDVSEITSEGAEFNAEISFQGDFEILSYGFAWGIAENPTVERSDRAICKDGFQAGEFSKRIETTLKEGVTYFVRAFVETNEIIMYGENKSFVSLGSQAPRIEAIEPSSIFYFDTIEVKGKGFSFIRSQNEVRLGEVMATILSTSDTLISIQVPTSIEDANPIVKVSTQGNVDEFNRPLSFISPEVKSISKKQVVFGDTIEIAGSYFGIYKSLNTVTIDETELNVISADRNLIKLRIPIVPENFVIAIENSVGQKVTTEVLSLNSPSITDISPDSAYYEDRVLVTGKNFSFLQGGQRVFFNDAPASVLSFGNTELVVIVPEGINNPISVKLELLGLESNTFDFYYLGPEIESISPSEATWGSEITIVGNNFSNDKNEVEAKIGGFEASVTASSSEELQIVIPDELSLASSQIEIKIGKGTDLSQQSISLQSPVYESITPTSTNEINTLITINGNYFNPTPSQNTVTYNDRDLKIVSSSARSVEARIDESVLINPLVSEEIIAPLRYSNAVGEFSSGDFTLQYSTPWSRLENLNFGAFSKTFQIGSKGYVITASKALYEFDLITEEWTQLSSFPGDGGFRDNNRYFGVGFALNDKIYFGSGYVRGGSSNPNLIVSPRLQTDFWVYDPLTDQWNRLKDTPSFRGSFYESKSFGGFGYLIDQYVYRYDPVEDSWQQMSNISNENIDAKSYVLDNTLNIVYTSSETSNATFAHYDESADSWITDFTTQQIKSVNDIRVLDGEVYLTDLDIQSFNYVYGWPPAFNFLPSPKSFSSILLRYNPATNSLTTLIDPEDKIALIPFAYNGVLFADGLTFSHQFYKYDPSF